MKVQQEVTNPRLVKMNPTEKTPEEESIYRQQKIECMIRYYNKLAEAGGMQPINLQQVTKEIIEEHERRDKATIEMKKEKEMREEQEMREHKIKRKEAYAQLLQKIMLMAVE